MKILPKGTELFHADGQAKAGLDGRTDKYNEANSRFSEFCESI